MLLIPLLLSMTDHESKFNDEKNNNFKTCKDEKLKHNILS